MYAGKGAWTSSTRDEQRTQRATLLSGVRSVAPPASVVNVVCDQQTIR